MPHTRRRCQAGSAGDGRGMLEANAGGRSAAGQGRYGAAPAWRRPCWRRPRRRRAPRRGRREACPDHQAELQPGLLEEAEAHAGVRAHHQGNAQGGKAGEDLQHPRLLGEQEGLMRGPPDRLGGKDVGHRGKPQRLGLGGDRVQLLSLFRLAVSSGKWAAGGTCVFPLDRITRPVARSPRMISPGLFANTFAIIPGTAFYFHRWRLTLDPDETR